MSPHEQLFGATRLAAHAEALARRHTIADVPRTSWIARRGRGPLLSRLTETENALVAARDTLAVASAAGTEVSPAGAWLLDNFFVVLEQVPEIRATLPAGYYRKLPKLVGDDPFAGYPRIYEIIIELIAHTDGRLDEPSVALMVREYQRVTALTLGELWAIPAMLRMGYLENIRRMALRAARDVADRALADSWVSRLLGAQDVADATGGLSAFVHRGPRLSPAFLTRFLQQIRSRRSDFTPLLWLEQWVAEDVMTVEDAAQRSAQELALTQLVMANSIASLASVARIDWTAFVEAASATEAILRGDPSDTYVDMTRATRDRYRHAVERIARRTGHSEPAVARAAITAARACANTAGVDVRESHVGYHLVGDGRRAFERATGYVGATQTRVSDWVLAHPGLCYFGALLASLVVVLGVLVAPLSFASLGQAHAVWLGVALFFALLPAADVALAVVHQAVNIFVPPARLPRLDYERAVPAHDRTAVVVPLLLVSVDAAAQALEHIEVQYLANRDPQVRFALLSDFLDAPAETVPTDDAIIAAVVDGIRALNVVYGGDASTDGVLDPPFYLLHRRRRWNALDAIWMGWERKRGKLVEFNAFIRGAGDQAFSVVEGEVPWLRDVHYVITLDADTMLPRGAAAALIGTIAHPLNRAEYDETRGRVVRGYGILQPRVGVSLASASQSRFAAIYAGQPGVDPYTTAVSDVYQDLFGEGSFTGKGIYDVDIFRQATEGRFPENSLLSHDLIEGAFARAGLVTDVEVFDDYPTRYLTSTRRSHRWIRGDWQLLRWLTSRVPGVSGSNLDPLSM
ncbi:MAG: cyclic beta 1-2 glucan synthetase, partial [Gemmatimonadaceae bacterium]